MPSSASNHPPAYRLNASPVGFDFLHMSGAQAQDFFDHFIAAIPERLAHLASVIPHDLAAPWRPDYSIQSLAGLSQWLAMNVTMRDVTPEETEALKALGGVLLHIPLPTKTLSARTLSIGMDCGIYFAECLRHANPELAWTWVSKPRNSAYYHRPVLGGFQGEVALDPITIGSVQAERLANDPRYVIDFVSLAATWRRMLRQ